MPEFIPEHTPSDLEPHSEKPRYAWLKLKSHCVWVWMAIPDGEPYPSLPPPGASKRDWGSIAS